MRGQAPSWLAAAESEVPDHDDWLSPPEADRLAAMRYTKRRLESRLGRWAAKTAVAGVMGLESTPKALLDVGIVNAADGAPEASVDGRPAGATISMTDRAGWAVCVVLVGDTGIGCDLELVEPRSAAFVADYLTPEEQGAVAAFGDAGHDLAANAIWSAKESALKVLRTGLRRDTRSVEVELSGRGDGWCPLVVTAADAGVFPGWWRRCGFFVLTMAAAVSIAEPQRLERSSSLDDAEPVHSWMARPLAE